MTACRYRILCVASITLVCLLATPLTAGPSARYPTMQSLLEARKHKLRRSFSFKKASQCKALKHHLSSASVYLSQAKYRQELVAKAAKNLRQFRDYVKNLAQQAAQVQKSAGRATSKGQKRLNKRLAQLSLEQLATLLKDVDETLPSSLAEPPLNYVSCQEFEWASHMIHALSDDSGVSVLENEIGIERAKLQV